MAVFFKRYIWFLAFGLMVASCSDFAKIQKSENYEERFQAGKNYMQEGKYAKAINLFESVTSNYRGTSQAEELLYLLAKAYMYQEDYMSASDYFDAYLRNFPKGQFAEEVRYQIGYCYYLDSPDIRLDQTATENAIYSFDEYLEYYPAGRHAEESLKYLEEMEDKLAQKMYDQAKLYYNLGLYGGNNYRACVVTVDNLLKEYPDSKVREDAIFLVLKSKAKEAELSVEEKKFERYSEVVDEYYRYINEYQNGKYQKEANKILKEARKVVGESYEEQ